MRQTDSGTFPHLLQMPDKSPQVAKTIQTNPPEKITPPDFSDGAFSLSPHWWHWLSDKSVAKMRRAFQRHKSHWTAIFGHDGTLFHIVPFGKN